MLVSERKKKENIAEYIIEMYKTEDLIRAYEFDTDQIEKYLISHLPVDDQEKQKIKKWYSSLADEMKSEEIEITGHLSDTQQIVSDLNNLHRKLSDNDKDYKEVLKSAKKHLDSFRKLAGENPPNDIQICLNGIYGLLVLRLHSRPVHEKQLESVDKFGAVLSYLSYKYRQV